MFALFIVNRRFVVPFSYRLNALPSKLWKKYRRKCLSIKPVRFCLIVCEGVFSSIHLILRKFFAVTIAGDVQHIHTGKCIRRFAGIYAYCRYFIDRKW